MKEVPSEVRVGRLEAWLRARRLDRTLDLYGGTQTCPWCKQCAQDSNADWRFETWDEDARFDVLTCGVCGGTSLWEWGFGMMYQRPLWHPALEQWEDSHGGE